MEKAEAAPPAASGQRLIYLGLATFLVACVVLLFIASRWQPESIKVPGFAVAPRATPLAAGVFQVTLDTADKQQWVGFNLGAGQTDIAAGLPADLYARRYVLRAPLGAADLGVVPLETASLPPGTPMLADEVVGGSPQSPVLTGWYEYSYWTHLLRSKGRTYAVKLNGGGTAVVQVVSYNCAPEGTGCLTLRYRLVD